MLPAGDVAVAATAAVLVPLALGAESVPLRSGETLRVGGRKGLGLRHATATAAAAAAGAAAGKWCCWVEVVEAAGEGNPGWAGPGQRQVLITRGLLAMGARRSGWLGKEGKEGKEGTEEEGKEAKEGRRGGCAAGTRPRGRGLGAASCGRAVWMGRGAGRGVGKGAGTGAVEGTGAVDGVRRAAASASRCWRLLRWVPFLMGRRRSSSHAPRESLERAVTCVCASKQCRCTSRIPAAW